MAVTTPDTSAVRAWARSNGYDVADRGRLPAELTDAYLAAQGKTAASTPAARAAKAAGARTPATGRKPATAKPAARRPAAAKPAVAEPAAPVVVQPTPKPVADDRRLVALGEQLSALTDRVAELEKALGSKPAGSGLAMRFRRSR